MLHAGPKGLPHAPAILFQVLDLDFELSKGYTVTRDDISQRLFLLHRYFCEERTRINEARQRIEEMQARNRAEAAQRRAGGKSGPGTTELD